MSTVLSATIAFLLASGTYVGPTFRSGVQGPTLDPSGRWEGSITAPDREVKVEVDLAKNDRGELAGTLNIPAQKLTGLELANVAIDGRTMTFQIKGGAAGQRVFKGVVAADGKTLAGDYMQGTDTVPFSLTRTGDAQVLARAKSAAVAKEFEGTWTAVIDVKGTERQMILKIVNQADGTAAASLTNVNEGLDIPIAAITQTGAALTLDLKAINGSYAGTMNAEHTELTGTFTQGPASLPMTFRRNR